MASRVCRTPATGSDVPGEPTERSILVKYVILIHSNPRPWGHPTAEYVPEFQSLPQERKDAMLADFERRLKELSERGELLGGEALGDAANARLYHWTDDAPLATDGPYSEAKEHLAGFFLIDVESQERAEEIAGQFASPGDTVELRATMWPGGDDQ
jgi:hypothetical protein